MTSFLSQVAMTNDVIKKRQQEDEDRAFQLRKQQNETAELDQAAYLRPYQLEDYMDERKQAQADRADVAEKRQNEKEQTRLSDWVQPYQTKTGANPDGTRSMDVAVPMGPAMAGAMAAGLGTMGNDLGSFMKPFQDQAIINSREYNTPEEVMKKAQLDEDHQRRLELEGARNDGRQQVAQIRKTGTAAGKAGSTGTTPGAKAPRMTDYDRSFEKQLDQFVEQGLLTFYKENKNQMPDPAELLEMRSEIARGMLKNPIFKNVSPQIRSAYLSGAEATKEDAATPKPGSAAFAADEDAAKKDLEELFLPPPPTEQTVNLQEKQGSSIPTNATPPMLPITSPSALPVSQNGARTNILPNDSTTMDELVESKRQLLRQMPENGQGGGLDNYIESRLIQERLASIEALIAKKEKEEALNKIFTGQPNFNMEGVPIPVVK